MAVRFDKKAARELESSYLTPSITHQRARMLAKMRNQLGDCVLDIGCGVGLLSESLATEVGSDGLVVAVDQSPAMVDATKLRCAKHAQVSVVSGSVGQLPFEPAQFDAAAIAQVLLYVPQPIDALRDIHRVLKPGGIVVVIETDWRGVVLGTAYPEVSERVFSTWDSVVASPRLPGELPGLLRASGFEEIGVEAIPVLETDWDTGRFSVPMVRDMIRLARKRGAVTPDEADRFWLEQQTRGESSNYFFCVNRFLFAARRVN